LFLLVAIPVEAYILNRRLKFDKRTSSFYAISMNVFSNVIGWIIFFIIERTSLFDNYRIGIINYILYNRLPDNFSGSIILVAFTTFFGTLVVKFALLKLFIISLSDPGEKQPEVGPEDTILTMRKSRRGKRIAWQSTSLLTTTLLATALSYTAITLVIVFRVANLARAWQ
ncbi:MAG: filament integrity protein fraC, partial [Cyanobacteriota bacterium]|nr:filament integrity protein fraC [Cyanobacteriota bacterium]